jgi:hypothetical protein
MNDDDKTPPRGGSVYTLGKNTKGEPRTMIDLGGVIERTADKVIEMRKDWPQVLASVQRQKSIERKLDVAIGLIKPWHERYAPAALVACAIVALFMYACNSMSSAKVPEPPAHAQSSR